MILDEAESYLDIIQNAITPLLQGIIPTCMVDPANLVHLYDKVKSEAAKKGLKVALADANEILTLCPFTFQRGDNYELLLSVPIIDPKDNFPRSTWSIYPPSKMVCPQFGICLTCFLVYVRLSIHKMPIT